LAELSKISHQTLTRYQYPSSYLQVTVNNLTWRNSQTTKSCKII